MAISFFNVAASVALAFIIQRIGSFVYRYIKTCIAARQVPSLPGATLIKGNLQWDTIDEYLQVATRYVQETGVKLNTIWVSVFFPVYSVSHPDFAKIVLKSNAPKDDNIGAAYTMLRPWIGNGLLAHQGGKEWERNRHLLTPAFHFDILKNYVNIFNDVADELLIQLSRTAKGCSVEISNPITVATLDSLLRCALSYHGNVQEVGHDHPYVDAVQKLAGCFNDRILNPFLYPDFIFYRTRTGRQFKDSCNYVHNFAENLIMKRRQSLEQSDINRNQTEEKKVEYRKRKLDFLDILLTAKDDQGKGLTDLQIRSEVDTFMFAGHDTTSSAISWAIHALAKYPEEQDKVHEEVLLVAGDQPVKWDDLPNLRYQSLFIKEVMRMYSIVPLIGRLTDEPMSFDGIIVPADSIIELNIHAMNHRQDVWPDHEVFRPERFEEPSGKGRDPFSFIPFSAGSRNCIGQNFATNEIKVIMSRLVQTYRIELDKKHTAVPVPQLVMRPKDGIRVVLHPRL